MDIWDDPTREDVRQLTVWGFKAWPMRLCHAPCGEMRFVLFGTMAFVSQRDEK